MIIKTGTSGLALILVLASCSLHNDQNDEPTLTEYIKKVETIYYQGAYKNEGYLSDSKIETRLNLEDIDKLRDQIDKEFNKNLKILNESERGRIATTLFSGYDVGVIPNINACPSGSEKITFFMDLEDANSTTKWSDGGGWQYGLPDSPEWGYRGAWSIDGNKNVTMVFCRVDGRLFQNITSSRFMVLQLGNNVPNASWGKVKRYFDNEDHNNTNYHLGDISPNGSSANTALFFYCQDQIANPSEFPNLGFGYGVLGSGSYDLFGGGINPYLGTLFTDDEDGSNANILTYNGVSVPKAPNDNGYIIYGGTDTSIKISKVKD